MSAHENSNGGVFRFLIDNSLLLVLGAVAALIWANLANQSGSSSYQDFIHFDVRTLWGGGEHGSDHLADGDAQHSDAQHSDAQQSDAQQNDAQPGGDSDSTPRESSSEKILFRRTESSVTST